jgi:hypothetical protein
MKSWARRVCERKVVTDNRDRQVVTATRLQLIHVVREWQESGKSVEQLIFRLKTTHINVPDTMIKARTGDLEPQDRMVKIEGKSFRCPCGCNVFRSPKGQPDVYVCNSCGAVYRGE